MKLKAITLSETLVAIAVSSLVMIGFIGGFAYWQRSLQQRQSESLTIKNLMHLKSEIHELYLGRKGRPEFKNDSLSWTNVRLSEKNDWQEQIVYLKSLSNSPHVSLDKINSFWRKEDQSHLYPSLLWLGLQANAKSNSFTLELAKKRNSNETYEILIERL